MTNVKRTDQELYDLAYASYRYDHETGLITWRTENHMHEIGSRAGTISSGGYRRIYLRPDSYQDSVIAYLMHTGEFHKYVARYDKDVENTKFNNLYPTDKRLNNNVFPKYNKTELAKALEASPLPVGKLAVKLKTSPHTINNNLGEMVLDKYIRMDRKRVFHLTAEGHRELIVNGRFEISERRDIGVMFQIALPGTLTGNEGPKKLHYELR